jgi:phage gpG-like protein
MAKGIEIKLSVKGLQQAMLRLAKIAGRAKDRTALHARFAILAHNWVMRNFASEGGLVGGWKPLSPNTLAGRSGGSGRVLQDNGILRGSFLPRWNSIEASVGSDLEIAKYHEYGTKGPYPIPKEPRPKGKWLRFKMATSTGVFTKTTAAGKTYSIASAKGDFVFAKQVMHPGLPARRMLPKTDDPVLLPKLLKAANNYVMQQGEGG